MKNIIKSFGLRLSLILTLPALCIMPAAAQLQITPAAPIQVNSPIITLNSSPGDQTDAHVNKSFAAYTDDNAGGQIRYYNFLTGIDTAIARDPRFIDLPRSEFRLPVSNGSPPSDRLKPRCVV